MKILYLLLLFPVLLFGQVITENLLVDLRAENYDGTDWTDIQNNRDCKEVGTVAKNISPDRATWSTPNLANYIVAKKTEDQANTLIKETGTVELWVKTGANFSNIYVPFSISDTSVINRYIGIYFWTDANVAILTGGGGSDYYINSPVSGLSISTWYHITWAVDSSLNNPMRLTINGIAQVLTKNTTADTTQIMPTLTGANTKLAIGLAHDLTPRYFLGDVGEVRFYNDYLTLNEILRNYNARNDIYGLPKIIISTRYLGYPKYSGGRGR